MSDRTPPWRCPSCIRQDVRPCPHSPDSLHTADAAVIPALRAENEKLKMACQLADQIMSQQITARTAAENERDVLRSRVERLEKALLPAYTAIDRIGRDPNDMVIRRDAERACFYAVQQARAALSQQEKE